MLVPVKTELLWAGAEGPFNMPVRCEAFLRTRPEMAACSATRIRSNLARAKASSSVNRSSSR
eukprot:1324160-Rhodomonas_salina.3